jgi:hypothetical protein
MFRIKDVASRAKFHPQKKGQTCLSGGRPSAMQMSARKIDLCVITKKSSPCQVKGESKNLEKIEDKSKRKQLGFSYWSKQDFLPCLPCCYPQLLKWVYAINMEI